MLDIGMIFSSRNELCNQVSKKVSHIFFESKFQKIKANIRGVHRRLFVPPLNIYNRLPAASSQRVYYRLYIRICFNQCVAGSRRHRQSGFHSTMANTFFQKTRQTFQDAFEEDKLDLSVTALTY